jgi:predicted enzyme related to lactoylglutathione lyase
MARVLGIGGVFFKTADEAALRDWYHRVLGIVFDSWGGVVFDPSIAANHAGAGTVFSFFKADTTYFEPSTKEFMINIMVDDLDGMLERCAEHGVAPVKTFADEPNGRFAHILDPDGRKIELWQPRPMAS